MSHSQHSHAAVPVALALTALIVPAGWTSPALPQPQPQRAVTTTVAVDAAARMGGAPTTLLGANHHYVYDGYHIWDPATNSPVPVVVEESRRAGVSFVRYPGGTVGNVFDWTRMVQRPRGCQRSTSPDYPAIRRGLAFGPDEYMRFLDAIGARPVIMVPWVIGTPSSAADWVEYMNSPAQVPGNPNGGVDWADVRAANGHPQPYGVRRWEIGNEQYFMVSRHWMSSNAAVAVRQYAFGGSKDVVAEPLGKSCAHPVAGIASDGTAGQVFEVRYPPLDAATLRVTVDGTPWHRVAGLRAARSGDRVYSVRPYAGEIRFGDGVRGRIPVAGGTVRASYRTVHKGFFTFARRMHAVDPHIRICSSWGTRQFPAVAAGRRYDCLTAHPLTIFATPQAEHWSGPLEGHDRMVLATRARVDQVAALRRALPARRPLWITESNTLRGDYAAFPHWPTSASHAVYLSSLWAAWMRMRLPLVLSGDLSWNSDRGVIAPPPFYTYTAEAVTRETLVPMFTAGGSVVASRVEGNPARATGLGAGYRALTEAATRDPRGHVHVLVVNRLPRRAVTATIRVAGFRSDGTAVVRQAVGSSYTAWNEPQQPPAVALTQKHVATDGPSLRHTFPAASTTVVDFPPR